MANKQYMLDVLRDLTKSVEIVNKDAKSIITLSVEKWTSFIKNNDDVLRAIFDLRKELIKTAYRKCTPGIFACFSESSTHKLFTFRLDIAIESIECVVENTEHTTEPELFSVIISNKPNGYRLVLTWNGAYAQSVTADITHDSIHIDDIPHLLVEIKNVNTLSDMHNNSYELYDMLHIRAEDIINRLSKQIKWFIANGFMCG